MIKEIGGAAKNVMSIYLLYISMIGSDNITVSNNKKYPKSYLCLWDSYTFGSKAL